MRYSANISAGSLKIPESRIAAGLLLEDTSEAYWRRKVVDENALQARNPRTAVRVGRLVRQRLMLMGPELWALVREGTAPVATHAVFAAAIKHSPLLGDFLDLVVRDQFRLFSTHLRRSLFEDYLESCRARDPDMPVFTPGTARKLQTVVYHVLVQVGYLSDARQLCLQPVHIASVVMAYLKSRQESYVLRCIEVSS